MSDAGALQPALPADVPPALRAAVSAALDWLRDLDQEADAAGEASDLRRPR
ncbi:MAG TPA: hypothetical protein VKB25_07390 [Conexibacter sp.]|nr:hypothetical protein [Conexibacter sp.]